MDRLRTLPGLKWISADRYQCASPPVIESAAMTLRDDREPDDAWPEALDAMTAAPENHTVLLENQHVRVLDTGVAAGMSVPVHTHRWPSVLYVLGWSDFVRYDAEGNVLVDSRKAGMSPAVGSAIWSAPLPPHRLVNVGDSELRVIAVELKKVSGTDPESGTP